MAVSLKITARAVPALVLMLCHQLFRRSPRSKFVEPKIVTHEIISRTLADVYM